MQETTTSNLKLRLHFTDRIGIVADVSALLAENGLNINVMEVVREKNRADVYFDVETNGITPSEEEIFEMLGKIPDLIEISFIDTLPQEQREQRFRVVLDNISDGVISIGSDGKITTINKVAKVMLNCEHDEIVGKDIKELNLPDYSLLKCLKGTSFDNAKQTLINENGRFQFFASGRPIYDSSHHIVGAVEIARDMKEIKLLAQSISHPPQITFSDFIGKHYAIQQAIAFAQKIAKTDSIVCIRGESGTGKELFARAIHSESGRTGAFVPLNCAALPESLLESELFGYVGGAFTGAKREGKPGLFEIANGGTIFLDEIAEMPLGPQAKILRVIQEKRVRRIGGAKEIAIDTRIITATNKNLEQMVKDKMFREDLYYRINVLPIHILPLKERKEDIPRLVEHFLFQLASMLNKNVQSMTEDALHKLIRHDWPGNIRELKNVIERAAILCEGELIDAENIFFSFEMGKGMQEIKKHTFPGTLEDYSLPALLGIYEKQIINEVLESSESIRKAAKVLGISHTALLNKLKKYQISMVRK